MDNFNKLTNGEAERLAMLAEECGEVVQIVGKILRHGYESHHPNNARTNRELLRDELDDIQGVQSLMVIAGDINQQYVESVRQKVERKMAYSHHQ